MRGWRNGRRGRRLAAVLLAASALFYGLCWVLSFYAAELFNREVNRRDLFPGTVTVERITADFLGHVEAEGVRWTTDDGTVLADVPAVRFHVKPWDVVTGRVGTMSVTEIAAEGAYIHLFFDENMRPLHIKPEHVGGGEPSLRLTGRDGNRLFDLRVELRDSVLEAESPGRHFRMDHVYLELVADTETSLDIDLLAGPFGGTVAADRLSVHGRVDFRGEEPTCDMALSVTGCVPSSLGAGLDLDDPVSVTALVKGPVRQPIIEGTLSIPDLNIPALSFTDVTGAFYYEKGRVDVTDVEGEVYGGTVEGEGFFDFDTQSWGADLKGHDLRGSIAARDMAFRCRVELDLHIGVPARGAELEAYGTFASGRGQYHLLPFHRIAGTVERRGRTIYFRDVVISIALGNFTTDAFSIEDGKVRLGAVYLEDALSGETTRVY